MFSLFEFKIALRYLFALRKEGFTSIIASFSLLGITLGVAALIIVMSVMNGFRSELLRTILGFNSHISIVSISNEGIENFKSISSNIKEIKNVEKAVPLIEKQSIVSYRGQAIGAVVHGVSYEDLYEKSLISNNIKFGRITEFKKENSIIIGRRMAEKLGVFINDVITMIVSDGLPTAFGTIPRMKSFKVVAIFEVGMREYDSSMLFIPLLTAQKFFRLENLVNGIQIFVANPDNINLVTKDIENNFKGGIKVLNWKQINSSLFNALNVENNVMFIILTIIILVAAFNIISSLVMLVNDKKRDIAIMRSMGATRSMIMKIFLLTGFTIGILGTLFGVILGLSFSFYIEEIRQKVQSLFGVELFNPDIYFFSKLPSEIDLLQIFFIVFISLVLAFFATLYPSWRAARLDPMEALRNV